jgi:SAM-dependent methyltransferase
MLSRIREPEKMDDPAIDAESHLRALDELAQINRLTRMANRFWRPLLEFHKNKSNRVTRVLDIGTGRGDLPIALAALAEKHKVNIEFSGIDLSQRCVDYASKIAAECRSPVKFIQQDALSGQLPMIVDVIISSQFMHHLDPPQIVKLLSDMKASGAKLIMVGDLVRNYFNLGTVCFFTSLFSSSKVAKFDGPVSVRAAFTIAEWQKMAHEAGLDGANIRPVFPVHMIMVWHTDEPAVQVEKLTST